MKGLCFNVTSSKRPSLTNLSKTAALFILYSFILLYFSSYLSPTFIIYFFLCIVCLPPLEI